MLSTLPNRRPHPSVGEEVASHGTPLHLEDTAPAKINDRDPHETKGPVHTRKPYVSVRGPPETVTLDALLPTPTERPRGPASPSRASRQMLGHPGSRRHPSQAPGISPRAPGTPGTGDERESLRLRPGPSSGRRTHLSDQVLAHLLSGALSVASKGCVQNSQKDRSSRPGATETRLRASVRSRARGGGSESPGSAESCCVPCDPCRRCAEVRDSR